MLRRAWAAAAALLICASARAERTVPPEEMKRIREEANAPFVWPQGRLSLAAKGGIPIPMAGIRQGFFAQLEGGYSLVPTHALAAVLQLAWYQPGFGPQAKGLHVDELNAVAALIARYQRDGLAASPYIGAGPGLFGRSVDQPYAPTQRELRVGVAGIVGFDMKAGPGSTYAEVRVQYAPSSLPSISGSSLAPLSVGIGYRVWMLP